MNVHPFDRRGFLKSAAATAGAGLVPGLSLASPFGPLRVGRKTERVVMVAFAGGVRTRETFGTPGNVPNLEVMAKEGVLFTRMRTSNLGHFGATMSMFTGIPEARGIRENEREVDPTLFEYLRKDLKLASSDVWITTTGGAQQTNYSHGLHPEYGPRYGATTMDGDGIFNREFKSVIERYGLPKKMTDQEKALLERMRGELGGGQKGEQGKESGDDNLARVEEYILQELTSSTTGMTGANACDAKALRLARNLLSIFRPRVTGVVLQNADIAHGSFNGYVEVIRRNDAAIGELWNAVKSDPDLAETTAFFVMPEFGRNADLNARRGLDHGDGSDDLNYVSCVAWGPDFKRGAVVKDDQRVIDVTPTICDLFGATPKFAKGSKLRRLFA
ncbi:MAG: twin-arginine translocation signal domain-containing protein [bacterium]|nr:twin-arginine translocation signal domain-containing protein [bacterium]